MTVRKIYISFIVFHPNEAEFASYGSAITEADFVGTKALNLHRSISPSAYVFIGFVNFNQGKESSLEFGLNIDNDLLLTFHADKSFEAFTLSYVVIGSRPS